MGTVTEHLPPNSLFQIFEEKEKDPSRILVELDKGLRSENVGEQCESILFFARLLSRYPFPSIVTTAFLKLADLYHGTSNNVIRYCIGRVFQEQARSNTQLLRVEQGDDETTKQMILQRLLQPLHSSDPCAKALTLRTLGSMSVFLAEDLGLQHSIRNCLSSSHPLEASAAIFAVDGVCERSPIFARSILPYIAELIQGLRCTPITKLKLIYVLRHMGHDPEMIHEARELLQRVLHMLPSHIFVLVSLHTLTLLTTSSLLYVHQHIALLFTYLNDPRRKIQLLVLKDLRRIIQQASHHVDVTTWPIQKLISLFEQSKTLSVRKEMLLLFRTLFQFFGSSLFPSLKVRKNCVNICESIIHEKDPTVCSLAAECLSLVSKSEEVLHCLSSGFLGLQRILQSKTSDVNEIRKLVFVLATAAKGNQDAECEFVSRLVSFMEKSDISTKSIFVKGLHVVLRNATYPERSFAPHLKRIVNDFLPDPEHAMHPNITATLAGCVFKSLGGSNASEYLPSLNEVDEKLKEANRGWERFVIARAAACNGFHEFSSRIFSDLADKVSSVSLHYWLQSLVFLCKGESMIASGIELLGASRGVFLEALTSIRAARLKNLELSFQEQFVSLRQQFIGLVTGLLGDIPLLVRLGSANTSYSIPFLELGQQYSLLRRSFLDLDSCSILLIETDQIVCCLLSFALDIFLGTPNCTPDPVLLQLLLKKQYASSVMKYCAVTLASLQEIIQSERKLSSKQKALTLTQIIHQMLRTRYCIPQYFFQSKPTSFVQIATNPTSPPNGQPMSATLDAGIILKISGLISHVPWKKYRKINRVALKICIRERFSDYQLLQSLLHPEEGAIHTSEIEANVTQDSFVASTILTLPQEGKFSVIIQCKVFDSQNIEWLERKNSVFQVLVRDTSR